MLPVFHSEIIQNLSSVILKTLSYVENGFFLFLFLSFFLVFWKKVNFPLLIFSNFTSVVSHSAKTFSSLSLFFKFHPWRFRSYSFWTSNKGYGTDGIPFVVFQTYASELNPVLENRFDLPINFNVPFLALILLMPNEWNPFQPFNYRPMFLIFFFQSFRTYP